MTASFSTGSCAAGTRSGKPRSRRLSNGTGRWFFGCAGRRSTTTTPPRMPSRQRSWSWRGRRARFANVRRSRAGCSELRAVRPHGYAGKKRRRQRYESRSVERTSASTSAQQKLGDPDPYPELHAEIERLPEEYRLPIVLCYFEGLTHEQAASRLRWPLGTVKIRLSRARDRLRSRLDRRGRAPRPLFPARPLRPGNSTALDGILVNTITQAACRSVTKGGASGLVSITVVKVTQGVIRSMLVDNLKMAAHWLVSFCWDRRFGRGRAGDRKAANRSTARCGDRRAS